MENLNNKPFLPLSALIMGGTQIIKKYYFRGIFLLIIQLIFILNFSKIFNSLKLLISLGTQVQRRVGFEIIQGHHSINILVDGIINLFILLIFLGVYIYNIREARNLPILQSQGVKKEITKFYDKYFPVGALIPSSFLVMFFIILPILITICVAFTNYSAPNNIPPKNLVDWVGIKNFINIFKLKIWSSTFIGVGTWTFIWAGLSTIIVYSFGFLLAICLNKKNIKFKGTWRFLFILPYAIPSFVSTLVFRILFNGIGPINIFLQNLGFSPIPFLSDPFWAKFTVIAVNTWIGAPYFMLLITSALTNVSDDIYEASEIDGASKFQQFKFITLPLILAQTAPSLILSFAHNFNNFGAIFLLTSGGPVNADYRFAGHTDILITWIYKLTLDFQQYNMAAVISILIFIFLSLIAKWQFSKMKSFNEEGI